MGADTRAEAARIARGAGALLKGMLGRAGHVEYKGAIDLVTEADRASEDYIVSELGKAFPGHGILAEERPEIASQGSPFKWVIDPLDGTTNYSHGFPFFCVSMALEKAGQTILGVVYDPMLDELFEAEKGGGAFLNGRPAAVSATDSLDRGLLATGFPYDLRVSEETNIENFAAFALRAQAIRRAGSAALDLCYTACGRFDGYWEMKLKPWDVAAGSLIVEEAGGAVTDFSGGRFSIYGRQCLASNRLLHQEMVQVLSRREGP